MPSLLYCCDILKEDIDDCGIYLEFVYDYNMDYKDIFGPAEIPTVDVFVFDEAGTYLFSKSSKTDDLNHKKRMLLLTDMKLGMYKILAVGALTDDFTITDVNGNTPIPGQSTIEEVRTSLVRSSSTVSQEFSSLWQCSMDIEYKGALEIYAVPLIKYTNRFYITFEEEGATTSSVKTTRAEVPYTFEIVTPEGAVYKHDGAPLLKETVTYTPYQLSNGTEEGEISYRQLNTVRLLDSKDYPYRIIVRNTEDNSVFCSYDLIELLNQAKPTHPDGSVLPMQEYLDRESEWYITVRRGRIPGYISIGIQVYDWIVWIRDIGIG